MKKSTGVILVLIIVLLLGVIGVGGYFFIKGNNDTSKEIGELKNEIANLGKNAENTSNSTAIKDNQTPTSNTNVSTTIKTYNTIKGTYEGKLNDNEDNLWGDTIQLILCEDGTFGYYPVGSLDIHTIGYYTIKESVLELNELAGYGNDVSLTICDATKKLKFTLNADGTITDTNKNTVLSKKTDVVGENYDIAKSLKEHLKNGYLY